ncbi:MAG TPA: alpha/beta hydrolase, partial [Candidatus Binataceae bacterium]
GPGAPGSLRELAAGLADSFRILEPYQRGSDGEPLSVALHVADLFDLIQARCAGEHPALVGHSWGAMLALAYAAAHPGTVSRLALIGCGTFDTASRSRMREIIQARMSDDEMRKRIELLPRQLRDPDERLAQRARLLAPVYSCDLISDEMGGTTDARAQEETWNDMIRLQEEGVYPAAFTAIKAPIVMLHGAEDPHPGRMIHGTLGRYLPQLVYFELERCGHYPWLEKQARKQFFRVLRDYLGRDAGSNA